MAQEFVVLKCSSCQIYQVQQSKKATKWSCKVCNHKQSIKQFFGRGSAKQCRECVQQLNAKHLSGNGNNHYDDQDIDSTILEYLQSTDDNSCDYNHQDIDDQFLQSTDDKSFSNDFDSNDG